MRSTTKAHGPLAVRTVQLALLVAGSFLSCGTALAQPLSPELLPPLNRAVHLPPDVRPSPPLTWQLYQQLTYQPGSWQGRLDLQPSLNLTLHDPQEGIRQEVNAAAGQLQALEAAAQAGRLALSVHRDFLLLQHHLFLEGFHLDLLEQQAALADPGGQPSWRPDTARREVELQLQASRNELELLARRLQVAGIGFTALPRQLSRPTVDMGQEPFATCLTASPEIRRLELLGVYQDLEAELSAAGRRLKVDLMAGLNLGLAAAGDGPVSPSFGWNAGLSVARADHGGVRLQLDVSPASVSQSLTIRGPEVALQEPVTDAEGLLAALEAEAQHVHSLLLARDLAADREELQRQTSEALLTDLLQALSSGSADSNQLLTAMDSVVSLLHAALQHDSLSLELATLCRLPLGYVPVANYP